MGFFPNETTLTNTCYSAHTYTHQLLIRYSQHFSIATTTFTNTNHVRQFLIAKNMIRNAEWKEKVVCSKLRHFASFLNINTHSSKLNESIYWRCHTFFFVVIIPPMSFNQYAYLLVNHHNKTCVWAVQW